MPDVSVSTTSAIAVDVLERIRALLDASFSGEFSEDDWQHALGGWHVVVTEHGDPVSHCRRRATADRVRRDVIVCESRSGDDW